MLGLTSPGGTTRRCTPFRCLPPRRKCRHGFARIVNRGGRDIEVGGDRVRRRRDGLRTRHACDSRRIGGPFQRRRPRDGHREGLVGWCRPGRGPLTAGDREHVAAQGHRLHAQRRRLRDQCAGHGSLRDDRTLGELLNPASNPDQVSLLRLVNPGSHVRARHDHPHGRCRPHPRQCRGTYGGSGASRTLDAVALGYGPGTRGQGQIPERGQNPAGRSATAWARAFRVTSPQHIMVMSLIENTLTGHMKNMSTGTNH